MLRTAARNFSIKEVAQTLVCADESSNHRPKSVPLAADDSNRATGFFNLLFRAFGETMGRNLQRLRDFTISQHDDVMLRLLDNAAAVHRFRSDLIIGGKALVERFQAHLNPLLLENIREAAFRQTTMQRHLAAFE